MSLGRGHCTLTLSDDKVIDLLFNVETIFNFSEKRGYSLLQLFNCFSGSLSLQDSAYLWLCGSEMSWQESKVKEPFPYTIKDSLEWLSDVGVDSDEWKSVAAVVKEIVENLASGKKKKLKAA